MNTVILSGNLVKEVKLEMTKNNKPFVKNTIAVRDNWNTEFEKTYFINFETFSKEAIKSFKDFKKGQLVEIQGKLVVESFKGKDGNWVNMTKIVVFKVQAIETKKQDKPKSKELSWDSI